MKIRNLILVLSSTLLFGACADKLTVLEDENGEYSDSLTILKECNKENEPIMVSNYHLLEDKDYEGNESVLELSVCKLDNSLVSLKLIETKKKNGKFNKEEDTLNRMLPKCNEKNTNFLLNRKVIVCDAEKDDRGLNYTQIRLFPRVQ